jgi:hypothetical protein
VSDVRQQALTFFGLYSQGQARADQIHDFIDAWHESGDDEKRSLAEFLGLTEAEYDVWLIAPGALPLILAARQTGCPLRDLMAEHFAELRRAARPGDRSVIHALGHWLKARSTD